MGWARGASVVPPRSSGPALQASPRLSAPCRPSDVSSYSSVLREALVPLVADHKCSSPEVYGADVSPNMLCAGYFDCRSDACQVSWDGRPGSTGPAGSTPRMDAHCCWRPGGQEWGPCSQEAGIEAWEGPTPKAQARASRPAKGRAVHVMSKAKPLFTQSSPKWARAIGRSQCPVSQGLLGSARQC